MALDHHLAGPCDGADQRPTVLEAAGQHGMPAVDEALGQPVMQRIRQAILDRPAALLPVDGILEPERTVGDEGLVVMGVHHHRDGLVSGHRHRVGRPVDEADGAVGIDEL